MKTLLKILKITGVIIAVLVVVLLGLLGYSSLRWDAAVARTVPNLSARHDSATIARGEFLFKKSLNCGGCHSPHDHGTRREHKPGTKR